MSVTGPRISAAFCRGGLEAVDALDKDLGQRVRAAMDASLLAQIESSSRLGWVPIACDMEMTRALFAVAGPLRAHRVLRDSMVVTFSGPMLKPLRAAADAIFGNTLKGVFTWTPRVWSVIYRDAGEVSVIDLGPTALDFELRGLPQAMLDNPNYLLGFVAAFEAGFEVYGVQGRVFLIDPDPLTGEVRLKARW